MDTLVGWEHGPATHGGAGTGSVAAGPTGPADDRPTAAGGPGRPDGRTGRAVGGRAARLRAQAEELTELLDLGFHHREVLSRLGTTVSLGVLVSGPAGSGKAALVRAVAAQVGARVHPLWAPEVAALTNDSAAAAGGGRPGLRSPDLLSLRIDVPLPDASCAGSRRDPDPPGAARRRRTAGRGRRAYPRFRRRRPGRAGPRGRRTRGTAAEVGADPHGADGGLHRRPGGGTADQHGRRHARTCPGHPGRRR